MHLNKNWIKKMIVCKAVLSDFHHLIKEVTLVFVLLYNVSILSILVDHFMTTNCHYLSDFKYYHGFHQKKINHNNVCSISNNHWFYGRRSIPILFTTNIWFSIKVNFIFLLAYKMITTIILKLFNFLNHEVRLHQHFWWLTQF